MAIENGTKLFFKNGLQSKYDALASKDAGTFYVTSDTHRLYLGDNLLSQAVITVASTANLTSDLEVDGQIVYVQKGNILCIYDATLSNWAQLNPDTAIAFLSQEVETTNNTAIVTTTIKENRGNHSEAGWNDSFKVTGANGIAISSSDSDTLTVGLEQLALSNGENEVTLAVGKSNNQIKIKGAGDTTVSADTTGLTISTTANDYRVVQTTATDQNHTKLALSNDAQGFILEGTLHLEDKNHEGGSEDVTFESTSLDPVISIGASGASSAHFKNGEAVIDTFTQAQITDKIAEAKRQMNAMTYMGKLDENNALPTQNVQIGDTYMVAKAGAYLPGDTKVYPIGTLVVAKGTEDAKTGYITSGLAWDAVQASDTDTTYTLTGSGEDKTIILKSSVGSEQTLAVVDDGIINTAIITDKLGAPTLTIKHGAVTHTATAGTAIEQSSGNTSTLSYISGVTVNGQGHVTNVETTTAKLLDTVNDVASWTIEAATGGVSLNFGIKDTASVTKEDAFNLTSSSLLIANASSGTDKKVSVDLVWGTF